MVVNVLLYIFIWHVDSALKSTKLPKLQEPSQVLYSLLHSIFLLTQPFLIGVGRLTLPLALNPLPNGRTRTDGRTFPSALAIIAT